MLSKNTVFHDKSKQIETKYQFIRDMVLKGIVKLQYIATDKNIVDVMTKPLSMMDFRHFRDKIGMEENVSLTEREC